MKINYILASLLVALLASAEIVPGPQVSQGGLALIVDYDADGRSDLLDSGVLYLNSGGAFGPGRRLGIPEGQRIVESLDINGDGLLDLLTIDAPVMGPHSPAMPLSYRVFAGQPGGINFTQLVAFAPNVMPLIGDFDADGLDDIALQQDNRLTFLRSGGDGNFTELGEVTIPRDPQHSLRQHLVLGDLDKDGHRDLVLRTPSHLVTLMGRADGSFDAPQMRYLPMTFGTVGLQLADVDSDGNLDIVFAANRTVRVLFGNGRAQFPRAAFARMNPRASSEFNAPRELAIGQFTGRHRVEIAGGTQDGDLVVLAWDNNELREVQRTATGFPGLRVFAASFRGTGVTDLYAAAFASPVVLAPRLYFGSAFNGASAQAAAPVTARRRSALPAASTLNLRVVLTGECVSASEERWSIAREGVFGSGPGIEAAFSDRLLYFHRGELEGVLVEVEAGRYRGNVVVETACGARAAFVDGYAE